MTPSDLVALVARLKERASRNRGLMIETRTYLPSDRTNTGPTFGEDYCAAIAAIEQLQAELAITCEQFASYREAVGASASGNYDQVELDEIQRLTTELGDIRKKASAWEEAADIWKEEAKEWKVKANCTDADYNRTLVERDALQSKLKNYEPINTYDGRDIESWRTEAIALRAELATALEDVSELRALDNEAQHGADELAADAGRYRWLRKGGDYTLHVINPDAGHVEGETLDAIIDTARAQTGGK